VVFLSQIITHGGFHLLGNVNYFGDSLDSFPNNVAILIWPDSIPTSGFVQFVAFIEVIEYRSVQVIQY
jgi:hypothetical protein